MQLINETYHSTIWLDKHQNQLIKRSTYVNDPRTALRWLKEVDALRKIGPHPNIVQLISATEFDLSITLSLAPGNVLSSYNTEELAPYASTILLQLSKALAHIRSIGLIHDDVKPGNIVFQYSSNALYPEDAVTTLIDLGACIGEDEFTKSGTPWYMAPEYVQHKKSAKTDVWALGITMLWVMGEIPLPEDNYQEWVLPHVWEDEAARGLMEGWLARIEDIRERIGREEDMLKKIVAYTLETNVEKRCTTDDMINYLEGRG